jgi:hypothetical protein
MVRIYSCHVPEPLFILGLVLWQDAAERIHCDTPDYDIYSTVPVSQQHILDIHTHSSSFVGMLK